MYFSYSNKVKNPLPTSGKDFFKKILYLLVVYLNKGESHTVRAYKGDK